MIDLELLRTNPELFQKACDNRKIPLVIDDVLALDERRRATMSEVQTMQAERNTVSKSVPIIKDKAEKTEVIRRMKELGDTLKTKEEELSVMDASWKTAVSAIPEPATCPRTRWTQ